VKAAIPHMIDAGRGGSIILTASVAARRALDGMAHYAASKHGVVGLAQNLAVELGPYGIRANALCPGNTRTPLALQAIEMMMGPILDTGDDPDWRSKIEPAFAALTPLNVGFVEPEDQANALLWLASEESRYVTGETITVDAGWSVWAK
jgi:NAD(P)-dependent dehydrogenase (short-subunit alcohol dehydrogenase family)